MARRPAPALALALVLCISVTAHAQTRPRFRSGVEVTSIDVTVVDDRGRPIADLKPAEFTVRVDGVPRRVVSADWVSRTSNTPAAPPLDAPRSPERSNLNDSAGGGRLILIVIDQPNMRFGGAVSHRAAINKFIERLEPADRVSVVNLGAGAKSTDFTTDRNQVRQFLSTSVGGLPYPPSSKTPGDQTFDTLRALISAVREIDAPKTIVLVSQGLVFTDYVRPSIAEFEKAAAAARTTIYALRLDERISDIRQKEPDARSAPTLTDPSPATDLSVPGDLPAGPAGDRGAQGMDAGGELETIAAATGGAMFTVVMGADSALARIGSELTGSYLLAVESAAADGDGKPHSLSIDVTRAQVTVRAARYLPTR
jgi:VWFA-related protein